MHFAATAVAIFSLAIWLYLAFTRGNFWHLSKFDDDEASHEPPAAWPNVVAIVPARNEAATIRQCVTSLLQQDYPGEFSIVVVDDHSADATAEIAKQAASNLQAESRITILEASPLPAGWTGKLWALHSGTAILDCAPTTCTSIALNSISRKSNDPGTVVSPPTYFWFSDADITHAPDTLRRLVSRAEHNHLDLTSLMVLLQAKSFPERLLIPPFLFFFLKLYPPTWIADPGKPKAGAAGGCILLRREALERIGGLSAIRQEIIDDCALASATKVAQPFLAVLRRPPSAHKQSTLSDQLTMIEVAASPTPDPQLSAGRIWMGLTRTGISLRAYTTFAEIRDLIARTAFSQLHYSAPLLSTTVLAMFLTYLAPVALLFASHPAPRILGLLTWLAMTLLYLPTIRFYRLNPAWAATLPAAALFYSYATLLSAARHHLGRGAQWKGRSQAGR